MKVSSRAGALALVVVALALTVTGVVVAATDSNPASSPKDALALNGYPPKSARLHVVISTGQLYNVTADVNVNFVTNAVEAQVQIPLLFSATNLDLRLVNGQLYAGSGNLSSIIGSSWVALPLKEPSLYGLSLEMTRPDLGLITGFPSVTVTGGGLYKTYHYHRDNVTITAPSGLPLTLPTRAAIDFSITLGAQGEMTATSFVVTSKTSTASISVTVVSYNRPAHIAAPNAKDVKQLNAGGLRKLFGSSSVTKLLSPQNVASLGQIRLN